MRNVVLIGFMGVGKTTTGRLLAVRLGRQFVDIDKRIELENNMSIREMVDMHGEDYFRQKEAEMISRVTRYKSAVIATGGGSVLLPENVIRLKQNSVIIALTASLEVLRERLLRRTTRPDLERPDKEEYIAVLLQERSKLYQIADFTVDTSIGSPPQITAKIVAFLQKGGHLRGRS